MILLSIIKAVSGYTIRSYFGDLRARVFYFGVIGVERSFTTSEKQINKLVARGLDVSGSQIKVILVIENG